MTAPLVDAASFTSLTSTDMRLPLLALVAAPLLLTACDTNQDRAPRRAIITAVQIDDAPLRDAANGNEWDGAAGGGPEVYFRLLNADESATSPGTLNPRDDSFVLNQTTPGQAWVDDVSGVDFPLVWAVDGGFEVRNLRDAFRVALYDYDPLDSDDLMGETEVFTFADDAPAIADGREDTIVLDGVGLGGDQVRVRLRVRYEY